mmetsp:Transcript_6519/g.12653  ORF Transcript_6519/g.12653 Transcript_6519/m.12653 type:complete len:238 (+) Transcript_6519:212-925(+)
MFSLAWGVYEWYTKKPQIRILVLGLDGAGKTTILERIKHMFRKDRDSESTKETEREQEMLLGLSKISPTVGLNIGRLEMRGVNVVVWDLGGAKGLRSIWDKYYADAHAIIWVVDSSDPSRFEEAKETLASVTDEPELEGIPLVVFANKSDLESAITAADVQNGILCEQRDIQKRRQVRAMSVSGMSGNGIQESFLWLVETLKKRSRMAEADSGEAPRKATRGIEGQVNSGEAEGGGR